MPLDDLLVILGLSPGHRAVASGGGRRGTLTSATAVPGLRRAAGNLSFNNRTSDRKRLQQQCAREFCCCLNLRSGRPGACAADFSPAASPAAHPPPVPPPAHVAPSSRR